VVLGAGLEVVIMVLLGHNVLVEVVVYTTTGELVDTNELNSYRSNLFPAPQNSDEFPVQTMLQSGRPFGAKVPPFEIMVSQ
jgi:hypothetical protein